MSENTHDVASQPGPAGHGGDQPPYTAQRWRLKFPYHWDADELISRRELLRFTVYTSGSIFAVTTLLAILGLLKQEPVAERRAIARVDEVPEGGVKYFEYPGKGDQAVLLHLAGGGFVAYNQTCTHLSCAVYYQEAHKQLVCPCHEGIFNPLTGDPVAGPPRRRLERIEISQEGDTLYAVAVIP